MRHLRYAAGLITAAWFMRRGYAVSIPAEPSPYDLIVEAAGRLYRVQVKTAAMRDPKSGQFIGRVSRIPLRDGKKLSCDPDEIDFMAIVDGDGVLYIGPIAEVFGPHNITVSTVAHRKVAL